MFLANVVAITTAKAAFTPIGKILKSGAARSPSYANFLAVFGYGSGGTSVDAWVQTSFDGSTWYDIVHFTQFTTASTNCFFPQNTVPVIPTATGVSVLLSDQSLAAGHAVLGVLGPWLRLGYKSAGTYATTSLSVFVAADVPLLNASGVEG